MSLSGQQLDTTNFIVIGEGLAAGQSNYGLSETGQAFSFPAQMAKQMGALFPQPLLQGPGLGDVLGFQRLPTRVPTYPQGSTRVFYQTDPNKRDEGPPLFVFNLSLPNATLRDALTRRPSHPIIPESDSQQAVINMMLGIPQLLFAADVPLWTQAEYAVNMNPTLTLIELGYHEALSAAVNGDPSRIPDPAAFREDYRNLVRQVKSRFGEVVITTIPDPIDTAYFTTALETANYLRTPAYVVLLGYGLQENDYVTRNGLYNMGNQLLRRKIEALPAGSIMRAAVAAQIRARVSALNTEIQNIARDESVGLYDMRALFARVRTSGIAVGSRRLTASYLGGFYSLDGFYPGAAGNAIIANEILTLLNSRYGRSFPLINVTPLLTTDPVAQHQQPPALFFNASDFGFSEEGNQ